MKSPRKYVHIGYPKSASTALQNFYFSKHPECYHMGNGYKSQGNKYVDEGIEIVAEVDIRFKKQFLYDEKVSLSRLQPHFDEAAEQGFKAVGLSSEFFCFPLGNEVDTVEKATRLRGLFGPHTVIVISIREQFSLLKSLYLEMLQGGYPGTYRKFLEYTLLYQVRSWCYDFCYDKIFDTYANLFGKKNVCMIPFELLKESPTVYLGSIAKSLGIENSITELRNVNQKREAPGYYEQLLRFNARFPREYGSKFYEPFSMNRMRAYFHEELELAVPHDRLADDFLRIPISQSALKFMKISQLGDIDLNVPKPIEEELLKIYGPSNSRLQEISGLDVAKHGYKMAE